jgi:hypothetical protein
MELYGAPAVRRSCAQVISEWLGEISGERIKVGGTDMG